MSKEPMSRLDEYMTLAVTLRARIAEMDAEVERLKHPLMEAGEDGTVETFVAVLEERATLRARVAALEEFVRHGDRCPQRYKYVKEPCTCGLASLLAPSEERAQNALIYLALKDQPPLAPSENQAQVVQREDTVTRDVQCGDAGSTPALGSAEVHPAFEDGFKGESDAT